jgi:hypothetical protein
VKLILKNIFFFSSLASIRAQARKELEAEAAAAAAAAQEEPQPSKSPASPKQQDPERLAVSGIYFACPLIGKNNCFFLLSILLLLFFCINRPRNSAEERMERKNSRIPSRADGAGARAHFNSDDIFIK